ncbi:hypothetical protein SISNIDRAFT_165093 [Sistotremastrum niveocremeum HHB9708]|uniref:Uncharacterized protein n=1 Tax=Sistotremastrum niveocremeum HHB9708 TaxID=1314777 RepID=A0A164SIM2_9AGAM|nr:hypothetical protein SISNIDRAFT_165093 [Sistotremastrum niveocremeum HHB9708]
MKYMMAYNYEVESRPREEEALFQESDPMTFLRWDTLRKVERIHNHVNQSFAQAIADVAERSNLYTGIARLPEELLSDIFTTYVEDQMDLDKDIRVSKRVVPKSRSWTKIMTM